MPIQPGRCSGHNTRLNCLEYHRDSELNCGATDFILLLARVDEMADGKADASRVRALRGPRGKLAGIYSAAPHCAPCSPAAGEGFRAMVALPRGTSGPGPDIRPVDGEDTLLRACDKWLLALRGENIDIAADI